MNGMKNLSLIVLVILMTSCASKISNNTDDSNQNIYQVNELIGLMHDGKQLPKKAMVVGYAQKPLTSDFYWLLPASISDQEYGEMPAILVLLDRDSPEFINLSTVLHGTDMQCIVATVSYLEKNHGYPDFVKVIAREESTYLCEEVIQAPITSVRRGYARDCNVFSKERKTPKCISSE